MKSHTTKYKTERSPKGTRIFKRSENGGWYFASEMNKKKRYFPLGFDKEEAMDLADKIRGHILIYPANEVLEKFQKKLKKR